MRLCGCNGRAADIRHQRPDNRPETGTLKKGILPLLAAALLAACGRTPPPSAPPTAATEPPAMAAVARRVMPAVVNVYALKAEPPPTLSSLLAGDMGIYRALAACVRARLEPQYEGSGTGSGFIINKRGYVLTNNHMIAGADRIIVRRTGRGETEEDARLLGSDAASDVALLKIRADYRHHVLPLGDSDALQPGEWVAAVGNPYGMGKTFTMGVVSAVKRGDLGIIEMEEFIQTDAAISPGNSGGPLINVRGEAVGINAAIQSDTTGIGFAVPINIAAGIMARMASGQSIRRGTLGITLRDLAPDEARRLGIEKGEGALVTGVTLGGPAHIAGIEPNDVIVRFNRTKIINHAQLKKEVLSLPAGARVAIGLVHERKPAAVDAVLAEVKVRKDL